MTIYEFYIAGKLRPVFHAEHPDDTTRRDERGRPVRARLERWWRDLLATMKRIVRKGGPKVQKVWNRLNRRPPPDEPLLKGLRNAREVTILHPSTVTETQARHHWSRYLARRWRSHMGTLLGDLAISPVVVLIMVVPGPNIIGYWFIYRIVTHLLAMRGVLWARHGWIPFRFEAHPALDRAIALDDRLRIDRVSEELGLDDLDDFMRRLVEHQQEQLKRAKRDQEQTSARNGTFPLRGAKRRSRASDENGDTERTDSVF